MYLEEWAQRIADGMFVDRDLLCVNSSGFAYQGPIKEARLDGSRLILIIDWWACHKQGDDWVRADLDAQEVFTVGYTRPAGWRGGLRLREGSGDTGAFVLAAGQNLVRSQVPTEFHIEAVIRNQQVYASNPFKTFKRLGVVGIISPHNAQSNDAVTAWSLIFVINAFSLETATREARRECEDAGFTVSRLRRTQMLPGY